MAGVSRRGFLKRAAAAGGAMLLIVPRHVLGGPGHTAPSRVLTRATIGTGAQGLTHVVANVEDRPPQQLAVCDVDRSRLTAAVSKAGPGCAGFTDFRRALDRTDIDVIYIATPPHWHALIAIAACQAGKDVLCEKPMTRFIREGRAVVQAARRYGRVVMVNTLGRGVWQKVRRIVAAGLLGRPLQVHIGPKTGFGFKVRQWCGRPDLEPQPVPADLDYDMWLGPAPWKPYHPHRVHRTFRCYWDYDGGGLADMGQHWLDAVQYVLGKDDTGPSEVEASAPQPAHPEACGPWDKVRIRYADGTTITLASGEWGPDQADRPAFIEGPRGRIYRDAAGILTTEPPGLLDLPAGSDDASEPVGFEEAVRLRIFARTDKPLAEEAHRSATLVHLANIAIRTGRPIQWDPASERVVGDEAAERLVDIPLRAPWHL